jgi:hypothetical protein
MDRNGAAAAAALHAANASLDGVSFLARDLSRFDEELFLDVHDDLQTIGSGRLR